MYARVTHIRFPRSMRVEVVVNERVANRLFEDLDELEEALVERCLAHSELPQLVSSCTHYHRWPDAA